MKNFLKIMLLLSLGLFCNQSQSFGQESGSNTSYEIAFVHRIGGIVYIFHGSGKIEEHEINKGENEAVVEARTLENLTTEGWEVVMSQCQNSGEARILLKRKK